MNKNKILSGGGKNLTGGGKWGWRGREVGGEGEGSRVKGGGKWGLGTPPVQPLLESAVVTLKISSRSSKSNELFSVSKRCSYASLVEKALLVQKKQLRKGWIYNFKDDDLENEVTLKVMSRSPKSYQLFILPQLYNTLSLAGIHCSIQEISYKSPILVKFDISKCWCDLSHLENKVRIIKI